MDKQEITAEFRAMLAAEIAYASDLLSVTDVWVLRWKYETSALYVSAEGRAVGLRHAQRFTAGGLDTAPVYLNGHGHRARLVRLDRAASQAALDASALLAQLG